MVMPFEVLMREPAVQENWFRRIIAAVVDWIILGIVTAIVAVVALAGYVVTGGALGGFSPGNFVGFGAVGFLLWALGILYFTVTESMWGASIGKSLLGLRVAGEDGNKPLFASALLRNVSRVHFLVFLLDLIGGLVLEGDPRQRFSDRIAKTVVYQARSARGGPYCEAGIVGSEPVVATAPGARSCPSCGAPAKAGDLFCGKCGAKFETSPGKADEQPGEGSEGETEGKTCPSCGAPAKAGDLFCNKCGAKLE
jgi:uncharacterized RDD family membrane protein YckC